MTLVQQVETLQLNNDYYEIGEDIDPTPELILSLEATAQLVIARRINPETNDLAYMQTPAEHVPFPVRPAEALMKTDSYIASQYYDEYDAYIKRLKHVKHETRPMMPIPPYIGTVQTLGERACFAITHLEKPSPTIHIPYGRQANQLYRTELATKL